MKVVYEKPNLNCLKFDYFPMRPCNWWHNIKQFFRSIKWAWQRITKGYCDYDLFDFDHFLSCVISNGLLDFSKDMNSFPNGMTGVDEWEDILKQIATYFYLADADTPFPYVNDYEMAERHIQEDLASGFELTENQKKIRQKYFDEERAISDYRNDCKDKGLELLKQYWFDLWD